MTRYKSQPGHGTGCTGTAHSSKKVDKRGDRRGESWFNGIAEEIDRKYKLWLIRRGFNNDSYNPFRQ